MAKREITTASMSDDELLAELRHFVEHFRARGFETCSVLFGWAWGMKYYPGKSWPPESLALSGLESKVREVEGAGYGRFGSNDLWLEIDGVSFLFCHESDIHVTYDSPSPTAAAFFDRWKARGFDPMEREPASSGG